MIGRTRVASLCALVLLLAADGGRNALARKLNDKSSADTADSDIDFRQTVITPRPLTERVFYNPNRGELGKVEDYVANVYIGDIYFAFADPVGAGVGSGAAAGIQFQYDKTPYFDYEASSSEASIGPGAKALAAAAARVIGSAGFKAAARGGLKVNGAYTRDEFSDNSISIGTVTQAGGGLSAGLYLDRTAGNVNEALEQAPQVEYIVAGH